MSTKPVTTPAPEAPPTSATSRTSRLLSGLRRRRVRAGALTAATLAALIVLPISAAQAVSGTINDQSSCEAAGGGSIYDGTGECTFSSALDVGATETLNVNVSIYLDGGGDWAGTVTINRSSAIWVGAVTNSGTLNINGSYLRLYSGSLTNTGTINVTNGLLIPLGGPIINNGQIYLGCNAHVDGVITGNQPIDVCAPADTTAPRLDPTVTPDPVLLNGTATVTANADDSTTGNSGIASSSCATPDTSTVGAHTVSCTAIDGAGNTGTGSASYQVVYGYTGFAAPVNNEGVINVAKAGSTIPLKWTLTDANGAPVTSLTSATVTSAPTSCSTGAAGDVVETYTAGASGLQNLGGGAYQYNWKTAKTLAGSCVTMKVDLGDGVAHTALFSFK